MTGTAAITIIEAVGACVGVSAAVLEIGAWAFRRVAPSPRPLSSSEAEARELEALEAAVQADGCDIWRPDPTRTRAALPIGDAT